MTADAPPAVPAVVQALPPAQAGTVLSRWNNRLVAFFVTMPFWLVSLQMLVGIALMIADVWPDWVGRSYWSLLPLYGPPALTFVVGVVLLFWYGDYVPSRFLLWRLRAAIRRRPDAVVAADDPDAVYVRVIPREAWRGPIPTWDYATDLGLLAFDPDRRLLLFEGDRQRWVIPAGCVRSVEVEAFYPYKLAPWTGDGAWLTVVRAEVGGQPWEACIGRRQTRFVRTSRAGRLAKAEAFCGWLRSAVLGAGPPDAAVVVVLPPWRAGKALSRWRHRLLDPVNHLPVMLPALQLAAGPILKVAGVLPAGLSSGWFLFGLPVLFLVVGQLYLWWYYHYLPSRFQLRWLRAAVRRRPGAVVDADEPDAVFVHVLRRDSPSKLSDVGLLAFDEHRRRLLFEGDRERWVIPAACVRSIEVEDFYPAEIDRRLRYPFPLAVVRAEVGGRAWEACVGPRPVHFVRDTVANRRAAAEAVCGWLRSAVFGEAAGELAAASRLN